MPSTINDVAKLAGVSRQTVSRVLNTPELVQEDTLKRVRKAMESLDYYPNITARILANKTAKVIGLFMPFSNEQVRQNLFFSTLSASVCQYCSQNDFVMQLFTSLSQEDSSKLFIKLYKQRQVGGLILTCPSINHDELLSLLAEKIPFILVGRPGILPDRINYIDFDNVKAASLAVSHLVKLGHRSIGFLNGPAGLTLSEDLRKGVQLAAASFDFPVQITELETRLTLESGYQSACRLFADERSPTAIFTADDLLALGVKKAADQLNWSIPHDLSLISGVKTGWGDILSKNLSYIAAPIEEVGLIAAEHMMHAILAGKSSPIAKVLPVELVEGETCAPPRAL